MDRQRSPGIGIRQMTAAANARERYAAQLLAHRAAAAEALSQREFGRWSEESAACDLLLRELQSPDVRRVA